MSTGPYQHNLEHLYDELEWLDLHLQLTLQHSRSRHRAGGELYISDQVADDLISGATRRRSLTPDETHLLSRIDEKREAITARVSRGLDAGVALRLPHLASLFGLNQFEAGVVVICLASELDTKYERLYAYLEDDATQRAPGVDLVLNLLCRDADERTAMRSAFLSSSRLFGHSLVQFIGDDAMAGPLLGRTLKLDQGIVHFLLGGDDVDPRASFCCRLVTPATDSDRAAADLELLAPFQRYLEQPSSQWVAVFSGRDRARQQETVRRLCSATRIPLLEVDLNALMESDTPPALLIPLLFREAALKGAAICLDPTDALTRDGDKSVARLRTLERAIDELGWVTFLAGKNAIELGDSLKEQLLVSVDFPLPTYPERKRIWSGYASNGTSDLAIAGLAARFRFTRREIRNAVLMAATRASLRDGPGAHATQADVEAACRAESNSRLIGFARKVHNTYSWTDLVLPDLHKEQLREIIDHVRNHEAVYTEWGFRRKHALGKGVNMLFSGPSGTGKTMAAGIIASELGLDCYKIDLSTVVSKYIGETEKNLNRIFAEAETSNAVLFFDEADALFGKRTEVKDSHDRYANIEVNYLLQKMEEHEGVVVLATNLSRNVDEAFLRRVHFSVVFPLPEKEERLLVWQHVFPSEAPIADDVDREFLARKLKITGGNIKNIAVGAAFLAKREDSHVTMRHIILSAKREFQKIGKLSTRAEFGDYHDITH